MIHIFIAVMSCAVAARLIAKPTKHAMFAHIVGFAMTIVSGISLLFFGYDVAHVCAIGLVYSVFSSVAFVAARSRLMTAVNV